MRHQRALAWLRWRLLVNGLRGSRRRDALERISRWSGLLAPALLVVPLALLAVLLAWLGFLAGRAAGLGGWDPTPALWTARALLLVVFLLPVLIPLGRSSQGGASGHQRLRLLPVPRGSLHLVQVVAGVSDPWLAFVVPGLSCFALGLLSAGSPGTALLALVAGLAFVATAAALGSLVSSLMDWLMRDRRRGEVFTLVFVLVISMAGMLPALYGERFEESVKERARERSAERAEGPRELGPLASLESFDAGQPAWTKALPSELHYRALREGLAERPGRGWLLAGLLGLQAAAFFALSAAAHRKASIASASSRPSKRAARPSGTRRLPLLSPQASAVAHVHARNALRSVRGRITVLLPGPLLAFLALFSRRMPSEFPLGGEFLGSNGWAVLAFGMLFSIYAQQALYLNQFATDRDGLSLLFLAPLLEREVLHGKAAGGLMVFGASTLLCLLCAVAVAPGGEVWTWIAVLLAGLSAWALLAPAAAALSALFPKTADLSKTGSGGNPHGLAVLIGMFLVALVAAPPAAVIGIVQQRMERPAVGALLMLLWAGVALSACSPLLALVARLVADRRENLQLVARGR